MTRQMLAELYRRYDEFSNNDQIEALEQYRQQDIVKYLAQNPELVREYERFHVPEVTMLICASDDLLTHEWASRYLIIRDLFIRQVYELEPAMIAEILKRGREAVRTLADDKIYKKIKELKNIAERKSIKYANRIKKIELEIQEYRKGEEMDEGVIEKKAEDSADQPAEIDRLLKMQENEKKCKATADEELNNITILCEAVSKIQPGINIELGNRRQEALGWIDKYSVPKEEIIYRSLLNDGEVTSEIRNFFKNSALCNRFARLLQRMDHIDYATEMIALLFQEGAIDLVCCDDEERKTNAFYNLLLNNPKHFVEFLIHHYPQTYSQMCENEDYMILFQMAVESDLKNAISPTGQIEYTELWNCIEDSAVWKWILSEIEDRFSDQVEKVIASLGKETKGRAANAFISAIEEKEISLGRVIKELLLLQDCHNRELVFLISNRLEQNVRKLQREINAANRKLDELSGRVFSELYDPVQTLEELTINVRTSIQDIPNCIVAAQLTDIIIRLREGLSSLNVYPLESIDTWKNQVIVNYDSEIHRYEAGESPSNKKVRVNTIGFQYEERGTVEKHFAKVIVADSEEGGNNGV